MNKVTELKRQKGKFSLRTESGHHSEVRTHSALKAKEAAGHKEVEVDAYEGAWNSAWNDIALGASVAGDEAENYPLLLQHSKLVRSAPYGSLDYDWARIRTFFEVGTLIINEGLHSVQSLVNLILGKLVENGELDKRLKKKAAHQLCGDGHDVLWARSTAVYMATLDGIEHAVLGGVVLSESLNIGGEHSVRFFVILLSPISDSAWGLRRVAVPLCSLAVDDEFHADLVSCLHRVQALEAFERYVERCSGVEGAEETRPVVLRNYLHKHFPQHLDTKPFNALYKSTADGEEFVEKEGILTFSGKFAGGLISDFRARMWPTLYAQEWWQEVKIGRTAFTVAYMYVATVIPTIAFGGLLQTTTCESIGITETMLAQGAIGVLFAIFGGNALAILRPSGPVVAFIGIVYTQALSLEVDFLALWAWICFWLAFFLIACALSDASYLVKLVTEFTEEIFSALISVVFMVVAGEHAYQYFSTHNHDLVAVFSLVLMILAFAISIGGEDFRKSRYLNSKSRAFIFASSGALAIVIPTILAAVTKGRFWGWDDPSGETGPLIMLDVPNVIFEPTMCSSEDVYMHLGRKRTSEGECIVLAEDCERRHWLVAIAEETSNNPDIIGHGFYLGFLLGLLFFVEQNITNMLMANPVNKLKRKVTFHWDLFVGGTLTVFSGLLGTPVCHAALPHSLYNLHALSVQEEDVVDGTVRRHILQVSENRLAAFLTNALILLTVLILPYMGVIPLPALFGMFFYFGFGSLRTNPMYRRLHLMFFDPSKYPPHHVIRRLRRYKVHLWTAIQIICLSLILAIKFNHASAIFFPVAVMALIPFRLFILPFIFTPSEIELLDCSEGKHSDDSGHTKKN